MGKQDDDIFRKLFALSILIFSLKFTRNKFAIKPIKYAATLCKNDYKL